MKTITISTLLLVIAIATSSFVISRQQTTETSARVKNVNTLRVHRQGKAVSLTWTVSGGNAAQFHVERSYDGDFFETIASVECNGASRYTFKDDSAFPGTIYYRICTLNNDGTEEISAMEAVRLVQRK